MKNPVFDQITRAIDDHRLLRITDEAGERVVEPYLIYESKSGDMLLHCWFRSGAWRTRPPHRFCNLHLEDIHSVALAEERFLKPHPDYNPGSTHFHRVIYQIDPRGPRDAGPTTAPRTKPKRRGPPVCGSPRNASSRSRRP